MGKQTEIRGHLIELFEQTSADEVADNLADAVLWVLNEEGVVIKVERDDALVLINVEDRDYANEVFLPIKVSDLTKAGYVAVAPLIDML